MASSPSNVLVRLQFGDDGCLTTLPAIPRVGEMVYVTNHEGYQGPWEVFDVCYWVDASRTGKLEYDNLTIVQLKKVTKRTA